MWKWPGGQIHFSGGSLLTALGSRIVTAELISVPISLIRVGHMGWWWRRGQGTEKKVTIFFRMEVVLYRRAY